MSLPISDETFKVAIPAYLDFSMLDLRRDPRTGKVLYFRRVLLAFARFNGLRIDLPDCILAEVIAAWYAAHRELGGASCPIIEKSETGMAQAFTVSSSVH